MLICQYMIYKDLKDQDHRKNSFNKQYHFYRLYIFLNNSNIYFHFDSIYFYSHTFELLCLLSNGWYHRINNTNLHSCNWCNQELYLNTPNIFYSHLTKNPLYICMTHSQVNYLFHFSTQCIRLSSHISHKNLMHNNMKNIDFTFH
jgi:hypothetical protein